MNAFFETTNGFNFQIIDPLIGSRGVRLTWFNCNVTNSSGIVRINANMDRLHSATESFQAK